MSTYTTLTASAFRSLVLFDFVFVDFDFVFIFVFDVFVLRSDSESSSLPGGASTTSSALRGAVVTVCEHQITPGVNSEFRF